MRKPRIIWKRRGSPGRICGPGHVWAQNLSALAASIAGEGAFNGVLGDARVAVVDVRDIAAVALKTLTEHGHEGKAYTITNWKRSPTAK